MGYDLHGLKTGPEEYVLDRTVGESACLEMFRIRHLETVLAELYKEKKVRGFCHLGIGQEAIPVGISLHLDPEDKLITSYRCHGLALVAGMDPKEIICEQLGSVEGCARGKGGSMHLYGKRFFGGHGIVGAQVPLGAGLAFAEKYRSLLGKPECLTKDDLCPVGSWTMKAWEINECKHVSVVCFGDGAANQGQVYETMNMAALWKLPVVFVCENNEYGMGTPVCRASASTSFYNRFSFMPGIRASGIDIREVAGAFKYAREYALAHGPILLEYTTYRYNGHSMTDAFTGYRRHEEVEDHKTRDPIEIAGTCLEEMKDRLLAEMNEAAHREMASIREVALRSERCKDHELCTDVLV
ncbi:pyruvate dehydrogenase E1 component alpha subunit [Nematocida homosporus]|uniref:pyruvate dehydrogenase E1 component alpha subunit n=1 Tax=Nematocida homosporus TaxID=1912981 RepID=UPI002220EDDB|nr:pyruvate dehydrogenase E1 component alpha subunit [Nematocida homosporus]KAI5185283.1 pyruvate dehydrogenase E1 component alpha subunit [Nematocida homosporus]